MTDSEEDLEDRLRKLKQLYEKELITKDEWEERKARILDKLTGTKAQQPSQGDLGAAAVGASNMSLVQQMVAALTLRDSPSEIAHKVQNLPTNICAYRVHQLHDSTPLPSTIVSRELAMLCYNLRNPSSINYTKTHVKFAHDLIRIATSVEAGEKQALNIPLTQWMQRSFCEGVDTLKAVGNVDPLSCVTDGAILHTRDSPKIRDILLLVREDKIDGSNADVQCACYHAKYCALTNKSIATASLCPVIVFTVNGTDLSIGGCAVTSNSHTVLDIYQCIKLAFSPHDRYTLQQVVNAIASVDAAIKAMQRFYDSLQLGNTLLVAWPWYQQVGNYIFEYKQRILASKLVFRAVATLTSDGSKVDVAIKFTQRYCEEAHRACAAAPKLLSCEQVAGWYIVVMDWIDGIPLRRFIETENNPSSKGLVSQSLEDAVAKLHVAGYVHGDLRAQNILVVGSSIRILDFDWAGCHSGAACSKYPAGMNHEEIKWPPGASDGELITQQHDTYMINQLLQLL